MHILHLSLSGPPIPAVYGGAIQQTVEELAIASVRKGHKVTVISRALENYRETLREVNNQGVNYTYVYAKSTSRKSIFLSIEKYLKVIKQNGPYDVIHIHAPYAAIISTLIRKKIGNPKIIWHVHNRSPLAPLVKLNKNVKIVGISKSVIEGIGGDLNDNRYSIIHNICREEKFPLGTSTDKILAKEKFNISNEKFVISFAGRIVPEKGIHILIEAIKSLDLDLQSKIILLVAGSSWFKEGKKTEFEERIFKESESINVKWLGYVDNWELHKVYHASEIFIVPSIWEEPAGQVVVEAQSTGTKVIASDVGGIPEYLSPYEKTVRPNSSKELALAIKKQFEKSIDLEHSRERAEWVRSNFSINMITDEWLDLYENC